MYLGISCYNHESAAALIDNNGNLINYYREESLSRVKSDKSFPKRSIKKIFEENSLNTENIRSICFYEKPLSAFLIPLKTALKHIPKSLDLISNQFRNFDKSSLSCYLDISRSFPGLENKILYVDHHLSHTLTALVYSQKKNNLCSLVVDGFGDRSTTSISFVNSPYEINELWSCDYPVSLGLFYSAITDFLGFQVNEGEFKVMGLASYGNSNSKISKKVSKLLYWDDKYKKIQLNMDFFDYHVSLENSFSPKLKSLIGEPRNPFLPLKLNDKNFQHYADIAAGAQEAIINILLNLFEYSYQITGSRNFLFSGGVAMNSASIEKIAKLPFIDEIIIPPSPGDAGSAIGAAYYSFLKCNKNFSSKIVLPKLFPSIYSYNNQKKLTKKIISRNFEKISDRMDESYKKVGELISSGEVIGISVGNSETGPRALGNRSLICDGSNHDAVNFLNTSIKNRSPFRPTAPCMQLNIAKKYYELQPALMQAYKSMGATCRCKNGTNSNSFPTSHVDKTARIQIVEKDTILNDLLEILKKYDIEILANSSLNLSGDPTCFDLIDGLMVCARSPLRYILTDFGLFKSKY